MIHRRFCEPTTLCRVEYFRHHPGSQLFGGETGDAKDCNVSIAC